MPLSPGDRIGTYKVVAKLGEGGMGEVYRAHDSALGRDVALKILPGTFASDAGRLARFEREARTLASLSHPNVAQVYGFHDGVLVLELLDGQTLRDRLTGGSLSLRKAVDIASQIARGLAAAHDRSIVHRDLKPENVFLLPDGQVKVLDFGLATQVVPTAVNSSETVAAMTSPGTVMGTVGYMAPEQVRGQAVDHRADLFSLGTVLHEMLTGQQPFRRDTAAETMTAILKEDPPDSGGSRGDVTPALDRIVRHCLEKNPVERFQTARDVAFALDALSGSAATPAQVGPSTPAAGGGNRWWMASTVVSTAAAIALAVLAFRPAPEPPAAVPYVLSLPLPDGVGFNALVPPALRLAISPDGRRLAFVGLTDALTGRRTLFVQSLDEPLAKPVTGGEDGIGPFWSPDGHTLGFSVREVVRKLEGENSTPVVVNGAIGIGNFVDGRRMLFFSRSGRIQELVPPATQARDLLVPSKSGEEYGYPVALPGGQRMLFSYRNVFAPDSEGIYIANLDGSDKRQVLPNREAINAAYASGALLYVRNQSIVAQPFDPERGTLSGEPTVVADSVSIVGGSFATAAFSVSANGALVYEPTMRQSFSRLQWLSRSGAVISGLGDDADYSNVDLSPDGARLAVGVMDPAQRTRDIWIVDVARGVRQRLTFDPSDERSAIWTPDSARVVYNSKRLNLYVRAANGSGAEEALLTDNRSKDPRQISPDGRRLIYRRSGDATGNDIWIMPLDGDRKPVAVLETPFNENYASFSPDGRSIVYASDESGEFEVYVLSLDGTGGKARISTAGGTFPRWRRDGREVFYLDPSQQIMSVQVSGSGPAFAAAVARPLFRIAPQPGPGVPFDVTPDGQRFIVNTEIPSRGTPAFKVVVNWPALMKRP